jgi:hypothetical protein
MKKRHHHQNKEAPEINNTEIPGALFSDSDYKEAVNYLKYLKKKYGLKSELFEECK